MSSMKKVKCGPEADMLPANWTLNTDAAALLDTSVTIAELGVSLELANLQPYAELQDNSTPATVIMRVPGWSDCKGTTGLIETLMRTLVAPLELSLKESTGIPDIGVSLVIDGK